MTLGFDLAAVCDNHNCETYFETGLGYCDVEDVSLKQALKCKFKKCISVEIDPRFVETGKKVFEEEINEGRCVLAVGDSAKLNQWFNEIHGSGRCLFFLDAHIVSKVVDLHLECPDECGPGDKLTVDVDGVQVDVEIPDGIGPGDDIQVNIDIGALLKDELDPVRKCPLMEELECIQALPRNDHVICIDDVRIITGNKWGDHEDIDLLGKIKTKLKEINPNYIFERLDGHLADDVLFVHT